MSVGDPATAVPRQRAVHAFVLVSKVLVEVAVEEGVENGVSGTEQVENAVDELLSCAHNGLDDAWRSQLGDEPERVEREPGEEEDGCDGYDDDVGPASAVVGLVVT